MKRFTFFRHFCLAVSVGLMTCGLAVAQDEASKTDTADQKETAAKVLKQLSEHMNDGDWSKVKNLMTEEAWDAYCSRLVMQCKSLTNVQLDGIDLPGLEDARESIEDALENHGLDQLDVEAKLEVRIDGDSNHDDEAHEDEKDNKASDAEDEEKEARKSILAAMDKNDEREKVVQDLFDAMKQSPFNLSVFAGKILEVEAEDKADAFTAAVEPKTVEQDSGEGIHIKMVGPPTVIVLKRVNGTWLYAGVDREKTAKAIENFEPNMGDGPRTDF